MPIWNLDSVINCNTIWLPIKCKHKRIQRPFKLYCKTGHTAHFGNISQYPKAYPKVHLFPKCRNAWARRTCQPSLPSASARSIFKYFVRCHFRCLVRCFSDVCLDVSSVVASDVSLNDTCDVFTYDSTALTSAVSLDFFSDSDISADDFSNVSSDVFSVFPAFTFSQPAARMPLAVCLLEGWDISCWPIDGGTGRGGRRLGKAWDSG